MIENKRDFVIVSDGSCDFTKEMAIENGVIIVPFYVSFDGKTYLKETEELEVRAFYQTLIDNPGKYPKSSLPTTEDYETVFNQILEQKKDIICVCITTKFSGSYNSAMLAKENCQNKYPDASITVIDSMINTGLQGLLVLEMVRMKKNGLGYKEIVDKAEKMKKTGRIYFTVGNLEYLRAGGRIGKLKALVGDALKIKPIIVLREGEIFSEGLSFTRKKSFIKATNLALEYFEKNNENKDEYQFTTGYGYDIEEGKYFHDRFKEILKRDDIGLFQIGATIGVHTGPYPLGIGFIKKYEFVK